MREKKGKYLNENGKTGIKEKTVKYVNENGKLVKENGNEGIRLRKKGIT